jgi:hypothetical protein
VQPICTVSRLNNKLHNKVTALPAMLKTEAVIQPKAVSSGTTVTVNPIPETPKIEIISHPDCTTAFGTFLKSLRYHTLAL